MSEPIIDIKEEKRYNFNIKGQRFQLTFDEFLLFKEQINRYPLNTSDAPITIKTALSPIDVNTSTGNVSAITSRLPMNTSLEEWKNVMNHTLNQKEIKPTLVPTNYRKIFEKDCDPRSAYKSKFVYYKDPLNNWGFNTISEDGISSSFIKMGRVDDITSILGEMYSKIPLDKPFVKRSLLSVGVKRVTEGRRLKACVDILEYEKKITRENTLTNKHIATYRKVVE